MSLPSLGVFKQREGTGRDAPETGTSGWVGRSLRSQMRRLRLREFMDVPKVTRPKATILSSAEASGRSLGRHLAEPEQQRCVAPRQGFGSRWHPSQVTWLVGPGNAGRVISETCPESVYREPRYDVRQGPWSRSGQRRPGQSHLTFVRCSLCTGRLFTGFMGLPFFTVIAPVSQMWK